MTTVGEIITAVAVHYGIDPLLALADGWVESSLRPDAVGDDGTSFGIYQLHEGGELGTLTKEQAFDVLTNASVALSQFAGTKAADPSLHDGALSAAAAQRPANQAAYAAEVDAVRYQIGNNNPPAGYLEAYNAPTSTANPYPPPVEELVDDQFISKNPKPGGGDYLCSWSTRIAVGIPSEAIRDELIALGAKRNDLALPTFVYFKPQNWSYGK